MTRRNFATNRFNSANNHWALCHCVSLLHYIIFNGEPLLMQDDYQVASGLDANTLLASDNKQRKQFVLQITVNILV